jgi:hypothetical protein
MSAAPTLTRRQLNRATLARQLLLERQRCTPGEALQRLVALQAQVPRTPFVALWSRLRDFERARLLALARRDRRLPPLRGTPRSVAPGAASTLMGERMRRI